MNIKMPRGDIKSFVFTVKDVAGELVEIDFENSTLSIRIRSSASSNSLESSRYPFSMEMSYPSSLRLSTFLLTDLLSHFIP
jgi:hypothetical protein